jgi:hypothetical protein
MEWNSFDLMEWNSLDWRGGVKLQPLHKWSETPSDYVLSFEAL